ncbi:TetR/AcrR family transcriptional regulator [Microbacterium sp. NIBRBAC000506063]|uniref:TetR/AcrR family transcriptional regulator n=1 Tax=Microbacterium sp. NIBRBAC000506063 TaxID=2734618 RepID=UPI001BB4DFE8|nr:TetR family transcriptional regulator [Microbacterium sp. NIBRBAC000506063]QTV80145.1 TetR/AcrR family transcriptional regulator [Microbacterium sp. NIBRBAC000506063]
MTTTVDGRRARGDRSRHAVLEVATQLASTEGLTGVSIAQLATETGASKSGVAALFGSKEQLQLAVVAEAQRVFTDTVVVPARAQPRGIRRLVALIRTWTDYSSGRTFAGGCFFLAVSAEFAARPGPVRDAIAEAMELWRSYLAIAATHAMAEGALPDLDDADQLVFELESLLSHANAQSVLRGGEEPYRRAEQAIRERLLALGADAAVLDELLA